MREAILLVAYWKSSRMRKATTTYSPREVLVQQLMNGLAENGVQVQMLSGYPARFSGAHVRTTVQKFLSTVELYKQMEKVDDVLSAPKARRLPFEQEPQVWWEYVKSAVTTCQQAKYL